MIDITTSERNGIYVFALGGRIDTLNAVEVDRVLRGAVLKGKRDVVLDMTDVSYINSSGSRTLADVLNKVRARGGDLKLAVLNQKVMHVFQIIGFDKVFSFYDTVEMAVAGF